MGTPFHIVDVFAEQPYAGNPLAVVLETDALSESAMQAIAAETNYSETAFVATEPDPDGAFRVRLFTPAREIGFAGHPILGTGWVVRQHVLSGDKDFVWLRFAIGDVSVTFDGAGVSDVAWFRAPPMSLGMTIPREEMAAALGLSPDDIDDGSPVQQVSAGTSAIIVPIGSQRALKQSRLDLQAFRPLAARGLPPLTYLYCREPHDGANHLCARFFFEAHGVREDPATGNGAAFLGAYLLEHHVLPEAELDLRIEQGHEVWRPSLVRLRARKGENARQVDIGGRVFPIVSGELL
jgi:trans-2,3-dihydro-3-hydroxyanthranilate isomerase